ncbi:MAG: hypothetical protein STHCBS139747_000084 [Sporothrix thermara]
MDSLSYELVALIASYLSAGDALNLGATCRHLREACLARVDPERYLQPTFMYARYLLAAMTDYGCILSGSRALEYFVPGSIDDPGRSTERHGSNAPTPSDWDFLVPCNPESVYGMMDALARCGVEWQHPLAEVLSLVDKPRGTSAVVRAESLIYCNANDIALSPSTTPSPAALVLFEQLRAYFLQNMGSFQNVWIVVTVRDVKLGKYQFKKMRGLSQHTGHPLDADAADAVVAGQYGPDGYQEYSYASEDGVPVNLINGYITPPGRLRQKVQLFQCHSAKRKSSTPLEYVLNTYYATHVQCFISGWAAGHFYYDLACQRLALTWHTSAKQKKSLRPCVQKYRRRGYRFFTPNLPRTSKNLDCDEYDDDLNLHWHHDANPDFAKATYTPMGSDADDGVGQTGPELMDAHVQLQPDLPGMSTLSLQARSLQRRQPPRGTPPPLSTVRTGRLSQKGYEVIQQHRQPVSSHRLGGRGTLLIRFARFQSELRDVIRSTTESMSAAGSFEQQYRQLEKSLTQFRFMAITRPLAIEPVIPELHQLDLVDLLGRPREVLPSLCAALALATVRGEKALGSRGAPPKARTKRLDKSTKEWRFYELLNRLTISSCYGRPCYKSNADMPPPQI